MDNITSFRRWWDAFSTSFTSIRRRFHVKSTSLQRWINVESTHLTQNIIFQLRLSPNPSPLCGFPSLYTVPLTLYLFLPYLYATERLTDLTRLEYEGALLVHIPKVSTTFHQWALRLFPYIEPVPIILLLSNIHTILCYHKANTIKTFFPSKYPVIVSLSVKNIFGGCYSTIYVLT